MYLYLHICKNIPLIKLSVLNSFKMTHLTEYIYTNDKKKISTAIFLVETILKGYQQSGNDQSIDQNNEMCLLQLVV